MEDHYISKEKVLRTIQNRLNFYRQSVEHGIRAKNYTMAVEYQAKAEACEMIFHNITVDF